MGSVAILCKLRNGNAYSSMPHWGVLQPTMDSKGGSGELHKGGGKGKLPTAFDFRDCRSGPQRKGSCKGDPLAKNKQHTIDSKGASGVLHKGGGKGKLPTAFDFQDYRSGPQQKGSCKGDPRAKNKQCQCMCAASPEGAARRCRHKPRNRHECMKCHTLVGTGCCWIEHRQLCHLCREEQLFLHLCYICAIASVDLAAEAYSQSPEEFLEERRHAFQSRQMRHGAVMAAGAGVWRRGLNDLGLTPCPGCAALTEVMPSLEA